MGLILAVDDFDVTLYLRILTHIANLFAYLEVKRNDLEFANSYKHSQREASGTVA